MDDAARRARYIGLFLAIGLLGSALVGKTVAPWLLFTKARLNGFSPARPPAPRVQEATTDEDTCGIPGEPDASLYGRLSEAELPWTTNPPDELVLLRREAGADRLLAGFRTTLPDPILEERYNISLAARTLAGTVVPPGAIFSQNGTLGPYTRDKGYREGPAYVGNRIVPSVGGGVCKISSTLYNVVVFSHLRVIERHPHSMTVPYVPPGRDATVSYGAYDFRFQNNTGGPVVIWADTIKDSLYLALYGSVTPPHVSWRQEILNRQPTWEVRRANPDLPPGAEAVVVKGADGVTVRTWIVIEHPDGTVERRDLGVDTYRPMPRVIEYGPGPYRKAGGWDRGVDVACPACGDLLGHRPDLREAGVGGDQPA